MKHLLFLLSLAIFPFVTACGGDEDSCSSTPDCFQGQVCVDGTCVAPNANNNVGNNDGGNNDGGQSNGATNNSTNNNGTNNNGTNNNSTNNGGTNNTNGTNNGTANNNRIDGCFVDPFSVSCMDDGNDRFSEAPDNSVHGCFDGDDFVPWEWTSVDARLCGLETADRYRQSLIPCDNISFIAEIDFKPTELCIDMYEISAGAQSSNCDEPDDKIRCELDETDGSLNIQIIVEPSNSLGAMYFNIEKGTDATNIDFDYELKFQVRQ